MCIPTDTGHKDIHTHTYTYMHSYIYFLALSTEETDLEAIISLLQWAYLVSRSVSKHKCLLKESRLLGEAAHSQGRK